MENTKETIRKSIKYIAERMELQTGLIFFKFNNRLSKVLGRAYFRDNPKDIYSFNPVIPNHKLNGKIKTEGLFIELSNKIQTPKTLITVIEHELAHLKTKLGDKDIEFQQYCRKNNIALEIDDNFKYKKKYTPKCNECGTEFEGYSKKCKTVKHILNNSENCRCPECEAKGKMEIIKRNIIKTTKRNFDYQKLISFVKDKNYYSLKEVS